MNSENPDILFFYASIIGIETNPERALPYIQKAVSLSQNLTPDHQMMFCLCYKSICQNLRTLLDKLKSVYNIEEPISEEEAESLPSLQREIADQMIERCNEACAVINDHLLPNTVTPMDIAIYNLFIGDFMRYAAEYSDDEEFQKLSADAYRKALEQEIPLAYPARLAAGLNYSILMHDLMENTEEAMKLVQKTCEEANSHIDELDNDRKEEAKNILKVLTDNFVSWS